ncbi:HAD family hydrolase [Oryzibacter oryziterrae]|uniref:HAD family hydrolase n=1 Tax=Oryzibacter oryziterrae TaxID=2766474 RepID=UPI001F3FD5CF|nr:HAD family hydrolase [Oryzibacter oryziterrae]
MPHSPITTLGLDADDTLWHNERFFKLTEARFRELLADHADPDHLGERLLAAEKRNLAFYGFGIKGFMLSMIETALDITERRVDQSVIAEILDMGREMLRHPVETLPGVRETLPLLAERFRLILITKGDLFDQERKLAQSGLGDLFEGVEIVSDKTAATYARVFTSHGTGPEHAAMVGNSLKSDIIPALEAGAWAVHIPHELTWDYEKALPPVDHPRFYAVESLRELVTLFD